MEVPATIVPPAFSEPIAVVEDYAMSDLLQEVALFETLRKMYIKSGSPSRAFARAFPPFPGGGTTGFCGSVRLGDRRGSLDSPPTIR